MKMMLHSIIIVSFLAFLYPGISVAGDKLDQEALISLIKGNTVEGKLLKWKTTYKMYFSPDGRFKRLDSLENKQGGEWYVEKDGTLRMVGRKEKYRTVTKRGDGGYDVLNDVGKLVWTMDKVMAGNPYDLKP